VAIRSDETVVETHMNGSGPPPSPAPVSSLPAGAIVDARCGGQAAGPKFRCVLTNDGNVACWGSNDDGELGSGATPRVLMAPTPVAGATAAKAMLNEAAARRGAGSPAASRG
jgi:hypothetical protein